MADPRSSYESRLETLTEQIRDLEIGERRLTWIRLAIFIAFVILVWRAFVDHAMSGWFSLIAFVAFGVVVWIHSRTTSRIRALERRARFCRLGIARIARNWDDIPDFESPRADNHLYTDDLDITGHGSLAALMSSARTEGGRDTLVRWLLAPAPRVEVLERQAAVRALRDRTELREEIFSVMGPEVANVNLDTFSSAEHASALPDPPATVRIATLIIAAANIVTLLGWLTSGWPRSWFFVSLLVSALLAWLARAHKATLEGVESLSDGLMVLETLLERIEHEHFDDPRLLRIHQTLIGGEEAAAPGIRRLRKLVTLLDSKRNQVFYPIAIMLLWDTNLSFAIGRWRKRFGTHAREWIEALGELEALLSIAGFSWENPDYAFPDIVDSNRPIFEAEEAGHPLIPPSALVRNDVRLDAETTLLVISGSNMSGKSTFLRTVGVNTVLALAGAPVCAKALELSDMRLGASIQVRDSLLEGRSRFYAEILRLRDIVAAAESGSRPFLFLLDEILHGTNSHDRRIGADAIVRSLLERGASGLVTTHDLALASIAEEIPSGKNVHFEDRIEHGEMLFDYRMKPGVVERSNAVELMRQIGLDV